MADYPSWDDYFMSVAETVRTRSKDRSTKIGCVIVGPDNEIRSTGYNSFVRGTQDNIPARHERPEKYFWTEHAERNAIYLAARVGTPLDGCKAYSILYPCMDCARGLIQAGISEVITYEPDMSTERWHEHFDRSAILFAEAGVVVRYVERVPTEAEELRKHIATAATLIKAMAPFLTHKAGESGDVAGLRLNAMHFLSLNIVAETKGLNTPQAPRGSGS